VFFSNVSNITIDEKNVSPRKASIVSLQHGVLVQIDMDVSGSILANLAAGYHAGMTNCIFILSSRA
jgi:hypothetical protein